MVDVSMNAPRPIERVWIIAIGSEMLTPFHNDTNSIYITEKLNDLGIEVRGKTIVGDKLCKILREFRKPYKPITYTVCNAHNISVGFIRVSDISSKSA